MQGDEMDTLRADSDRFDAFVLRHLASEAESVQSSRSRFTMTQPPEFRPLAAEYMVKRNSKS